MSSTKFIAPFSSSSSTATTQPCVPQIGSLTRDGRPHLIGLVCSPTTNTTTPTAAAALDSAGKAAEVDAEEDAEFIEEYELEVEEIMDGTGGERLDTIEEQQEEVETAAAAEMMGTGTTGDGSPIRDIDDEDENEEEEEKKKEEEKKDKPQQQKQQMPTIEKSTTTTTVQNVVVVMGNPEREVVVPTAGKDANQIVASNVYEEAETKAVQELMAAHLDMERQDQPQVLQIEKKETKTVEMPIEGRSAKDENVVGTTTTTTVTKTVAISQGVQACTSAVETAILEANNVHMPPLQIEATAPHLRQPNGAEETTPAASASVTAAVPMLVKMRQKTVEKQKAVIVTIGADGQPATQSAEKSEIVVDERKDAATPAAAINNYQTGANASTATSTIGDVETVELRRAVEELQAVHLQQQQQQQQQQPEQPRQQNSPPQFAEPVWQPQQKQNGALHEGAQGGGGLLEQKTLLLIQRQQPEPEPQQQQIAVVPEQQPVANGTTTTTTKTTTRMQTIVIGQEQQFGQKENARPVQIIHQQQHPSSTSPTQQQLHLMEQNGAAAPKSMPGSRSPFGQLDTGIDEDWRLSPKTLSRIKRLKVVMEPEEAGNGDDGGERHQMMMAGMPFDAARDAGAEVIHHHPVFVKDTSRFWYKPMISREEAIGMLKNKPPGTFVVRDSNSFPGAFGLALKVAQPPAGVTPTDGSELVRHFLIEPSTKGVRLKGCSNEPVFGTLAALVYQHSITPLALPCRLILPEYDPASTPEHLNSNQALLERGAACNVTYLCSVDQESLTGPEAIRRSIAFAFDLLQRRELRAVPVHFKVSAQGITLTDNTRSLFFRRHYPVNTVTFAGIDPESRVFDNNNVQQLPPTYVRQAPVFGFVARKNPTNGYNNNGMENACHVFAELDPDQPASAVVRFITNVMMPAGRAQLQQIHQNATNVPS